MAKEKFRIESDLLGELQVPKDAYYGVQTQRGINNYRISNTRMCDYPDYVISIAYVKWAAIQTNNALGVINNKMTNFMFKMLEKEGVPTHLVEEISDRETIVKKVSIVPLEVIIRNVAAGSFSKRMGVEEGKQLLCLLRTDRQHRFQHRLHPWSKRSHSQHPLTAEQPKKCWRSGS